VLRSNNSHTNFWVSPEYLWRSLAYSNDILQSEVSKRFNTMLILWLIAKRIWRAKVYMQRTYFESLWSYLTDISWNKVLWGIRKDDIGGFWIKSHFTSRTKKFMPSWYFWSLFSYSTDILYSACLRRFSRIIGLG
jgi:hypothetical protein